MVTILLLITTCLSSFTGIVLTSLPLLILDVQVFKAKANSSKNEYDNQD